MQTQRRVSGLGIAGSLILLSLLAGCAVKPEEKESRSGKVQPSEVTSETPDSGKRYAVGVCLSRRDNAFNRQLEKAIEEAGAANHLTLDVKYTEGDAVKQEEMVTDFLGKRVNAVVLCPADLNGSQKAIAKANEANVPVFTAEGRVANANVVAHIGNREVKSEKAAKAATPVALPPPATPEIVTDPATLGKTTIETVAAYLRGEKVPPVVEAGPVDSSTKKR